LKSHQWGEADRRAEIPLHRLAFLIAIAIEGDGTFAIEDHPSRNVRAA
jgi:hypothetical protein